MNPFKCKETIGHHDNNHDGSFCSKPHTLLLVADSPPTHCHITPLCNWPCSPVPICTLSFSLHGKASPPYLDVNRPLSALSQEKYLSNESVLRFLSDTNLKQGTSTLDSHPIPLVLIVVQEGVPADDKHAAHAFVAVLSLTCAFSADLLPCPSSIHASFQSTPIP